MNTDQTTIPRRLANMDRTRLANYRNYLNFYKGQQWTDSTSKTTVDAPWLSDESRPNYPWIRRLTLNYAKTIVDKLTSYLMSDLNFAVDPVDDSPEARELARRVEDALYGVHDRNHLAQLDFDTEIDAAVLGDGCYKVIWDPSAGDIRITSPDVQGLYAWWIGDDVSQVWRVASRYALSAEEISMLHGIAIKEQSASVVEVWTDQTFELWIANNRVKLSKNPYGFIPFVIYPNLREPKQFWGISDLPSIMQPTRELNRAMSQLSMILELSGNPIAVLENVEKADEISVQPGAVWEIPEKAKAYLLDLLQGGGVKLHIDYIDALYRAIHDLSEAPRTSFGDNQRALSGVALEMELHPLLQKIRRKRLIRGVAYSRRNEMILRLLAAHGRLGERPDLSRLRTRIIWGEVLPQDRGRMVDEEVRLVASGIHTRARAADQLGVQNPELEYQRWLDEEAKRTAINAQQSDLLFAER